MTTRLQRRFPRLLQVCHRYSQFLSPLARIRYEAWKHGNLMTSKAAEVFSFEDIAACFSGTSPLSFSSRRSSQPSVWILQSSLADPVTTSSSSSLVLPTSPGRISRGTRSRHFRSIQRPLTLLRLRRDGGDSVLTGATRRLRSVRFSVHSLPVIQLFV